MEHLIEDNSTEIERRGREHYTTTTTTANTTGKMESKSLSPKVG